MGTSAPASWLGGAAVLFAASIACAQTSAGAAPGPSAIVDRQGVRRDTSSTKYALPSVKIPSIGVKSRAPRGIGRKGGSLLPPPVAPAPPGRVRPGEVEAIGPVRAAGRRADPGAVAPYDDRTGRTPPPAFDRRVLESGNTVEIARMLRPAIAYSYLSRRAQLRQLMQSAFPCAPEACLACAFDDYFRTVPDAFSFRTVDAYTIDTYQVDANGLDPFVSGAPALSGPAGAPAAPPAPVDPEHGLTDFERAGNRLYDGKPDQAVVLLRAYVDSHPDEPDAARGLALALIDARRTREGVELMGQVYARHPALAADPLPADAVGPEYEMRDLVVRAVEYAHGARTPDAWLSVAVLMQAEGRTGQALKMIDRADAVGLAAEVSSAMRSALAP